jgi:hypothetical protein
MSSKTFCKALIPVIGVSLITVLMITPIAWKATVHRQTNKHPRPAPSKMLYAPAKPRQPQKDHPEPWIRQIIGSAISVARGLAA